MEVPRLRIAWEMQLSAYNTATATWEPSSICDLYHSSWQCRMNLTHWVRPGIEVMSSWILVRLFLLYHNRNSCDFYILFFVNIFFTVEPTAYGSSLARDRIQVTAVTWIEAVAMPDPLIHCTGREWNLCLCSDPSHCNQILNPLHNSRNSCFTFLRCC